MAKLYDIAKDYIGFLESDLPEKDLKDCLESIEGAIEEKASNIIAVVTTLDSDTSAIDDQINRLQERKRAITTNKERLKEYLRYNMEQTGITKIKHPLFNITLGKAAKKVHITDVDLLPDELVSVDVKIKPDLNKIKAALKDGSIDGAEMVEGKSRLLIK